METGSTAVIIGFVNNLMFTTKIETVAEQLDYQLIWIGDIRELGSSELDENLSTRQFVDSMVGQGVILLEKITNLRPALIIIDLGNDRIPWRSWLPMIKSDPSTRRLPVICFGAHIDAASLTDAREFGADGVFARSRFMSAIQEIIQKYARIPDEAAIIRACAGNLSEHALKGLELFNIGEYFEAHEELEFAWKEDDSIGRELYRAVLQVAVAYLQIERRNYKGAYKMFLRVRQWLGPLPDVCRGINIGKLKEDSSIVYQALIELGPERVGEFNSALLQPVEYRT